MMVARNTAMDTHSDTNPPAIEFRNVNLSFDNRLVLADASFTLAHGEMIFLTGISGSGKSVLLRLAMAAFRSSLPPMIKVRRLRRSIGLCRGGAHPWGMGFWFH